MLVIEKSVAKLNLWNHGDIRFQPDRGGVCSSVWVFLCVCSSSPLLDHTTASLKSINSSRIYKLETRRVNLKPEKWTVLDILYSMYVYMRFPLGTDHTQKHRGCCSESRLKRRGKGVRRHRTIISFCHHEDERSKTTCRKGPWEYEKKTFTAAAGEYYWITDWKLKSKAL